MFADIPWLIKNQNVITYVALLRLSMPFWWIREEKHARNTGKKERDTRFCCFTSYVYVNRSRVISPVLPQLDTKPETGLKRKFLFSP